VSDKIPDRVRTALLAAPAPRCAYVYDRATLVATARAVREALPESATLLYAVKANGHPDVLAALASEVDGFEVASGGELALARIARAGIGSANQIAFGGPAKTDAELAAAVEAEATVNVESPLELRRLAVAAESSGVRVRVGVRVNRGDPLPGSHQMAGVPTPFGIDEAQLDEVVDLAWGHPSLRLGGFSLHAVSTTRRRATRLAIDALVGHAASPRHEAQGSTVVASASTPVIGDSIRHPSPTAWSRPRGCPTASTSSSSWAGTWPPSRLVPVGDGSPRRTGAVAVLRGGTHHLAAGGVGLQPSLHRPAGQAGPARTSAPRSATSQSTRSASSAPHATC
jgi:diaminopimelate decarboxylase